MLYFIVICGVPVLVKGNIYEKIYYCFFGKSVIKNTIWVLIFSANFWHNISRFKKNTVIYYHKFTYIFMKLPVILVWFY
jgi:hypothetical protein